MCPFMEPDVGEGTSVAVSPAAQCWCGARSRLPGPACSRSDKNEGSGAQGLCHHHLGLGAGLGAVGHPHVHRTGTLVVPTPSFGMGNLTITDATLFRPVNHLFIFNFSFYFFSCSGLTVSLKLPLTCRQPPCNVLDPVKPPWPLGRELSALRGSHVMRVKQHVCVCVNT